MGEYFVDGKVVEVHLKFSVLYTISIDIAALSDKLRNETITPEEYRILRDLVRDPHNLEMYDLSRTSLTSEQPGEYTYEYIPYWDTVPPERRREVEEMFMTSHELEPIQYLWDTLVPYMHYLAQDITDHKPVLDILADFANIIGIMLPVIRIVSNTLHYDKNHRKINKTPEVTVTFGEVSITIANEDLEDAENAAANIAKKLLEEHPEALPCNKLNISGKLVDVKPTSISQPKGKVSRSKRKRTKK